MGKYSKSRPFKILTESSSNLEGRDACRFSGRKRLVLGEMDMFGACLYLTMPIVYFTLPILLQIFVFKTAGSYILSFSAGFTLSVGWSYRFTERFCLDGNILMKNAKPSTPTPSAGTSQLFLPTSKSCKLYVPNVRATRLSLTTTFIAREGSLRSSDG